MPETISLLSYSGTRSAARDSVRATRASSAPRRTSSVAAANPMPLVAPVIRTRLPATPPHAVAASLLEIAAALEVSGGIRPRELIDRKTLSSG